MDTVKVKTQLIGALKEMNRAERSAFFKDHSIQFAGAKAFWYRK